MEVTKDYPYRDSSEYLADIEIYIDLLLIHYLKNNGKISFQEQQWISQQEQKYNNFPLKYKEHPNLWGKQIEERYGLNEEVELELPVKKMKKKFALDDKLMFTVFFSAFCMVKREYQQIVKLCTGKQYPDFIFCQQVLSGNNLLVSDYFSYFSYRREQVQFLFPRVSTSRNMQLEGLSADARMLDLIWGEDRLLNTGVHVFAYERDTGKEKLLFRANEKEVLNSFLGKYYPLFYLVGEKGSGRKALARKFCEENEFGLTILNLQELNFGEEQERWQTYQAAFFYAKRECILQTTPLLVEGVEVMPVEGRRWMINFIKQNLLRDVQLIFFSEEKRGNLDEGENTFTVELHLLDEMERGALWRYFLDRKGLKCDVDIELLTNTFQLNPGQMMQVVERFRRGQTITRKELYHGCYALLEHKLGEKAVKISSPFTWKDLKLDDNNKKILKEVCDTVKYKDKVMNRWKFKEKLPYGGGTTVLFVGPPGTGKTMAAHVLANELGMEMYRVDMSQILDKYVGETEKNFKLIFEEAKKSNSILFFDEADAVFNKRMEMTGANERYANIESSLLLQYVEEYTGISILATNHVAFIDVAFMRRFKFYLKFQEPDRQTRLAIWKSVFPKEAPLGKDVDLKELADEFEFTGAIIKNIAVYAAYLAAAENTDISMRHIIRAVSRELGKNNGVNLVKDKLGRFAYLYNSVM